MVSPAPHTALLDDGRDLVAAVDEVDDAGRAFDQHVRAALGVNNTDFGVLQYVDRVRRRGGAVRVGDLAERFGIGSGTATEIVHRLSQAGLVRRVPDPTDARARCIELTATAESRLAAAVGAARSRLDALLASIADEERDRLIELLGSVRDIFLASAR